MLEVVSNQAFESGTVNRGKVCMYIEATMGDLSSTGVLRYFSLANDNATRQSDVASLARAITDRRAKPRYLDKAEESREDY